MSDIELLEYIDSYRFLLSETKTKILSIFQSSTISKKEQIRTYFATEKRAMIEFLQSLRLREDIAFHKIQ